MPYIGNKPEVGNFRKCDAITTSATATYNLLVGGVAVNPNQNQCIVSLNGVIQSSGNSYTIASSQITFASALTSSDVIDFILILGDVLDVGTVSDDTISAAKIQTDAVTQAKIADEAIDEARMQISNAGSNGQFLSKQSGNTGGLTWAAAGETNTPAFKVLLDSSQLITTSTDTVIAFDTEIFDTDSAISSGVFTVPSGKAGKYFFTVNSGFSTGNDIDNVSFWLSKNSSTTIGSNSGSAIAVEYHHDGTQVSNYIQSVSGTFDLAVSDTVRVYIWHNFGSDKGTAVDGRCTFSGFRILT